MSALLIDTSVLIKWFHSERETEVAEARALRAAHQRGDLEAFILDLALYEMGNVLARSLRWSAATVSAQLDDLIAICGPPLTLHSSWFHRAAEFAEQFGLSFYDAAWAACADGLTVPLVTTDAKLLRAGLAQSPAAIVERYAIPMEG